MFLAALCNVSLFLCYQSAAVGAINGSWLIRGFMTASFISMQKQTQHLSVELLPGFIKLLSHHVHLHIKWFCSSVCVFWDVQLESYFMSSVNSIFNQCFCNAQNFLCTVISVICDSWQPLKGVFVSVVMIVCVLD